MRQKLENAVGWRLLDRFQDFAEGLVPVHHGPAKLVFELVAVQARVGGAFGGGGVFGGGDGFERGEADVGFGFGTKANGFGGKAVPGGFAGAGAMVDSACLAHSR